MRTRSGWFWLGVALVTPWVVRHLFPQYAPGLTVLNAIICYVPFVGIAYILTSFLVSHQEQASIFWVICIRFTFFALFLPFSVSLFGVMGTGIEYARTLVVDDVLRYIVLLRKHPHLHVRYSHLFRYDSYDRAVLKRISDKLRYRFNRSSA